MRGGSGMAVGDGGAGTTAVAGEPNCPQPASTRTNTATRRMLSVRDMTCKRPDILILSPRKRCNPYRACVTGSHIPSHRTVVLCISAAVADSWLGGATNYNGMVLHGMIPHLSRWAPSIHGEPCGEGGLLMSKARPATPTVAFIDE